MGRLMWGEHKSVPAAAVSVGADSGGRADYSPQVLGLGPACKRDLRALDDGEAGSEWCGSESSALTSGQY
jgi:hypothetical protein